MRLAPRTGLLVLTLLAITPAAHAQAPTYYSYPSGVGLQAGVAAEPDGTVWFAGGNGGAEYPKLIRFEPDQGSAGTANGMTAFTTPELDPETSCCARLVRALSYDAIRNRVWFSRSDNVVGYLATAVAETGTTKGMRVLRTDNYADTSGLLFRPWGIATASNGNTWVAEHSAENTGPQPWRGNRIAMIIPPANDPPSDFTGGFTEGLAIQESGNLAFQDNNMLDSSRYDAQPRGIAVDSADAPWFAEAEGGFPGYRIATHTGIVTQGAYHEYLIQPCQGSGSPCSGSNTADGPTDVAPDKLGGIWFANPNTKTIGVLKNGLFTNYALSSMDPQIGAGVPTEGTTAPDGTVWFTVRNAYAAMTAIVKITPSDDPTVATSTVYKLGTDKSPVDIAADNLGNVWFPVSPNTGPAQLGRLSNVTTPTGNDGGGNGNGGGGAGGGTTTTPPPTPGAPTIKPVTTVLRPATVAKAVATDPKVSGTKMKVTQSCVGPPSDPCSLVYLIESNEYVTGFPGSKARAAAKKKPRKQRVITVGKKTVTMFGGQTKTITITLNAKGKALLKKYKRLPVRLRIQQKQANGKLKTIKTSKARFRAG
jgi:streptogramin lyase